MTRKVGFGILVLVAVVSLTSCQSIQLQSNYVEDDLYYSDPSHHNINPNTIGLNDQVAVPDSALVYFDESYAASLRPDYQRRLGIGGDDPVSFEADTSDYYNPKKITLGGRMGELDLRSLL
ncbi:hypothetical protein KFE98_11670 [bacterium SCSIO 12741]|nr:hypothetical protein KFE98_11670 [bacterium SCSIO 12741]